VAGDAWQVHCTRFTPRTRRWLGAKEIVALVRVENCQTHPPHKTQATNEQQTNGTFLQRVSIQKPYERQLEVIVLEQRVALVGSAPPRRALEEVVLCRVTWRNFPQQTRLRQANWKPVLK
jgi:hypothetical protein